MSIPADRLELMSLGPRQYAAMARFDVSIELDSTLRHLIKIRASQINGCAFCIDMHWKDARAEGESEERLYMLSGWRESELYDDRERAALALTEAVTLVSETHVPDDVWERAAAQFDDAELAQVLFAITAINAWNRIAISTRIHPGYYQPGMFETAGAR